MWFVFVNEWLLFDFDLENLSFQFEFLIFLIFEKEKKEIVCLLNCYILIVVFCFGNEWKEKEFVCLFFEIEKKKWKKNNEKFGNQKTNRKYFCFGKYFEKWSF